MKVRAGGQLARTCITKFEFTTRRLIPGVTSVLPAPPAVPPTRTYPLDLTCSPSCFSPCLRLVCNFIVYRRGGYWRGGETRAAGLGLGAPSISGVSWSERRTYLSWCATLV